MNSILLYVIQSIYVLMPAGFANMSPILFKKYFKFIDYPMDFGLTIKGKRVLGENKRWSGFVAGIVVAMIITFGQRILFQVEFFRSISVIDYDNVSAFLLGFLLGFGALTGDAIKSFFKRRLNFKPGDDWWPFDQMDWVIGSAFAIYLIYEFTFVSFVIALIVLFVMHVIVKRVGYWLKLDKQYK